MNHKNSPFITNQYCHSLTQEGLGVVLLDSGKVAFVENLLPGEWADLEIIKEKKTFAIAKITKLIQQSKQRLHPPCDLATLCGGCTVLHLQYDDQLKWKENIVRQNLQRIGGFSEQEIKATVHPILGMKGPLPKAYRNKVQLPCQIIQATEMTANQPTQALQIGYFAKQSHRIIPHETCLLQPPIANVLEKEIKQFIKNHPLFQPVFQSRFHPTTHAQKGLLRHLLLRFGQNTKQVMVVLVLNISLTDSFYLKQRPLLQKLAKELANLLPKHQAELKSFYVNFQTAPPPAILGKELDLLWGDTHIQERLGDFVFNISPHSFFQINTSQTEILYQKVLDFAQLKPSDEVFDLYCGTGSISLFLAKKARHVTGIEIVPSAIDDAILNAKINGLAAKTSFFCGAAEMLGPRLCHEGKRPQVVILDPPRKGCDFKLLQAVRQMGPDRIVYVSCDPATLARDLKFLTVSPPWPHHVDGRVNGNECTNDMAGNRVDVANANVANANVASANVAKHFDVCFPAYQIKRISPIDLFPHTMHVETVVLMSKVNPNK